MRATLTAFTDAASLAVARAIADVRRDAARERELREAEHRARMAEWDAQRASLAATERALQERIATLKDGRAGAPGRDGIDGLPGINGKDGDAGPMGERGMSGEAGAIGPVGPVGERGERGLDGRDGMPGKDGAAGVAGKDGLPGRDGQDGAVGPRGERGFGLDDFDTELTDEGRTLLFKFTRDDVEEVHEIPLPVGPAGASGPRGEKGDIGERGLQGESIVGPMGERGAPGQAGERGMDGAPGKLTAVKAWQDTVHYEADIVTVDGSVYQALRDTGRAPPHDDWLCIVAGGRDGKDGRSLTVRGTYSDATEYHVLDVVALNGGSFIARRDAPGPCPGDGWQLIAGQGKQGKPGERGMPGARGERGEPGPAVRDMAVDGEGRMTVTNSDGTTVECDLYPVLAKL